MFITITIISIIITIILTQACIQIPSVTLLISYNVDKSLKSYIQKDFLWTHTSHDH